MQISLRSQMLAGTTALVGATAIAMTPIAPAVSLPSLNITKAAVTLAAIDNPINAIVATGGLAIDYLINGQYQLGVGGGAANWGSGMGTNSGIGDFINAAIYNSYSELTSQYLPAIKNVGIIPNILSAPLPVLTQVVNNWLGYAGIIVDTGAQVLGNLSNLIWAPVGLTVAIANAVITGNIPAIPGLISDAIQGAISGITNSIQAVVAGVQSIAGSIVAKASALVTNLSADLQLLTSVIPAQVAALSTGVTNNIANITNAIATGNIETIWNAAVASLLGPTGIPGTLLNMTLGAGVVGTPSVANPTGWVPSVRATVQTLGQSVAGALSQGVTSSASAVRSAAAKKAAAPAAAVAAASTEAASTEAASNSDAAPAPAKAAAKTGRSARAAAAAK